MTTLPIQTTDAARDFLIMWMRRYFPTDRTFGPYITEHLAGDFAFQLANALAVPVSGSAGDALEAAAQLVIQRTSVPRDLLGPATAQMKAKAAAGEQLAAAIRSLRPAASGSDGTAAAGAADQAPIEITPGMIQAGIEALALVAQTAPNADLAVTTIYRAMHAARASRLTDIAIRVKEHP